MAYSSSNPAHRSLSDAHVRQPWSSVAVGGRAEQAAAEHLGRLGYEVIAMNYRRKHCEIDIIARRSAVIYFVEVKYRASDRQGSGLDYITAQKLQHMARAAQTWVTEQRYGGEYTLSAIELSGPDYEVEQFIESIY